MRFPTPGLDRHFWTPSSGSFLQPPSPCSLAQTGFILSYASFLYRVLPSSVRLRSENLKRLPWGSRSLFATSAIRVLCPEPFSSARCLAARDVSHVLDGLLRDWLCGFISPHCHVQGSLFRGLFPRPQPIVLSHDLCPHVVRSSSANGSCPPSPLHQSAPSGLCSASESVTQLPGVSR